MKPPVPQKRNSIAAESPRARIDAKLPPLSMKSKKQITDTPLNPINNCDPLHKFSVPTPRNGANSLNRYKSLEQLKDEVVPGQQAQKQMTPRRQLYVKKQTIEMPLERMENLSDALIHFYDKPGELDLLKEVECKDI
jgi:hypothetical protein